MSCIMSEVVFILVCPQESGLVICDNERVRWAMHLTRMKKVEVRG